MQGVLTYTHTARILLSMSAPIDQTLETAAQTGMRSSLPKSAKQRRQKRPLRLRDMGSAAQSGGWFWLEKDSVDRILIKATGVESGLMIAVYAALCRLSSDRSNATSVTAGLGLLVKLSGCSRSSVLRSVAALERVKLIAVRRVKRGRINDENTYFLLGCSTRKNTQTLVSEGEYSSVCETRGVVSENGMFSDTELKEKDSKSLLSKEAKTPMACAEADAQHARRFANKSGLQVKGLGGW